MRIVVSKHWQVYLVLGHTGSLGCSVYSYNEPTTEYCTGTSSLHVYKKYRIASLLPITMHICNISQRIW